jgi:hypothetical protein
VIGEERYPARRELEEEVRNSRRLIALLIKKLGGEVVVSPKELLDLHSETLIHRRDDPDGGWRFKVEEST